MSKSTKFVAGLGVAAALAVAMVPAAGIFAEGEGSAAAASTKASTNGKAEVQVVVGDAIAMTIAGNNDKDGYAAVDNYNDRTQAADGSIDPFTGKSVQNVKASSSLLGVLPNMAYLPGDKGHEDFASTIKVYTNAKAGYKLSVKAESANDLALTNADNDKIPAGTTLKAGKAAWGYQVKKNADTAFTSSATVTAITEDDVQIDGEAGEADGKTTTVYYGVSTDKAQPTGTYQSTLVYTATNN